MTETATRPRASIPYDIPLGEGEFARLVLPHDLSTDEAERLCAVIRSVAFTDEELSAAAAELARQEAERAASSRSFGALLADWAAVADLV